MVLDRVKSIKSLLGLKELIVNMEILFFRLSSFKHTGEDGWQRITFRDLERIAYDVKNGRDKRNSENRERELRD